MRRNHVSMAIMMAALVMVVSPAFAQPFNVAWQQSYAASPEVTDTVTWWLGEDPPLVKFTDGTSNWGWSDVTGWMGGTVPSREIELTVDLGATFSDVVSVEVDQFVSVSSTAPGFDVPIAVSGSVDDITYTPWGSLSVLGSPGGEEMWHWAYTAGSPQTARYVKFDMSWTSGDPHVLLSEVLVFANTVPVELSVFSSE